MRQFGIDHYLLFALLLVLATPSAGQIQTMSGGTFGTATLAGSSKNWSNPGNVAASDNVYATFGNLSNTIGAYTNYLVVTNFGFSIPAGTTVTGIYVEIERSDPNFRTADYSIRIIKKGTISTLTDRSTGTNYPPSDSYQGFGSSSDLWAETWSPADINDPGFGVAVAAQRNNTGGTTAGRIDHIRITVAYNFNLPVRLLSFGAARSGHTVQVRWTTASESQMDHYEIQRSGDGRNFQVLGQVASLNDLFQADYAFTDSRPLSGTGLYRLKMVGLAGDISYSRIVAVPSPGNPGAAGDLQLFPNPFRAGSSSLQLNNPGGELLEVRFFTLAGQQLAPVTTTGSLVPTASLAGHTGLLIFQVIDPQGHLRGQGKLLVR
ncbi:MAG TPA: hypothetical protein VG870_15655 [Chitinophagaceae bacterium]|nr:hypothetical protein [Chitinophagaceae bacterium]